MVAGGRGDFSARMNVLFFAIGCHQVFFLFRGAGGRV